MLSIKMSQILSSTSSNFNFGITFSLIIIAKIKKTLHYFCLLYTSDAADDSLRVDLGGRRIIKKKFFQAEDGIRDRSPSRGLGDVYKRQGDLLHLI